eukprot:gene7306-8698_t
MSRDDHFHWHLSVKILGSWLRQGKRSTLWTNLKRTIVVPRGHIGLKSILKKAGRLRTAAAAACAFLAMHEETAPIRLDPYSPSQECPGSYVRALVEEGLMATLMEARVWTSDSADHHGKFEGQQELEEMCGAALMHLATVKHVHSIGLVRQTIGMVNLSYDAHGQMGVQVHTPTIMFLMTTMWGMARSDRVNRDSFHRCNTIGTIGSLFKRFPHFLGPLEPLAERDAMSARMRRLHAAEAKHQQEFLTGLEYAVALLWLLLGDEVEDKCITPDMSQSMREWKVEGDGVSKQVEGVDLQEAGPRMPRTSHVQGHVGQLGEDHTRMVKGRRQWPEEAEASSSFHEGAAVLMEVMRMPSWSGNVTMQRLAVRALWQLSYRSKQLQALFTDGGMPRAMLTLMSKAVDTALSVEATYALQLLVRPDDPGEGAAVPVAGDGGAEGAENRPEEGGKLREEIKAIKKRRTQERRQKQAMWEKMNDSRRLKAIARSRTSLARTQDLIVEAARQCDAAEHLYDQKWWSFYIADLEQEIQEERATITKLQDPGTEVDTLGNIVVDPELEALKKESMLLKADIEDSIKISSLDPDHSLLFCKPKEQERMTLLEYNWPAQEEHNATFQTQEDREEEVEERMGQERMIRADSRAAADAACPATECKRRSRAESENKTLPDAKVHYDAMTLMLVQLDRPEWEIAGAGALGVGRWAMYKGNKKALLSLHTIPALSRLVHRAMATMAHRRTFAQAHVTDGPENAVASGHDGTCDGSGRDPGSPASFHKRDEEQRHGHILGGSCGLARRYALMALLNLSIERAAQREICRYSTYSLLRVMYAVEGVEVEADDKRVAGLVLANISDHPLGRNDLYQAELRIKGVLVNAGFEYTASEEGFSRLWRAAEEALGMFDHSPYPTSVGSSPRNQPPSEDMLSFDRWMQQLGGSALQSHRNQSQHVPPPPSEMVPTEDREDVPIGSQAISAGVLRQMLREPVATLWVAPDSAPHELPKEPAPSDGLLALEDGAAPPPKDPPRVAITSSEEHGSRPEHPGSDLTPSSRPRSARFQEEEEPTTAAEPTPLRDGGGAEPPSKGSGAPRSSSSGKPPTPQKKAQRAQVKARPKSACAQGDDGSGFGLRNPLASAEASRRRPTWSSTPAPTLGFLFSDLRKWALSELRPKSAASQQEESAEEPEKWNEGEPRVTMHPTRFSVSPSMSPSWKPRVKAYLESSWDSLQGLEGKKVAKATKAGSSALHSKPPTLLIPHKERPPALPSAENEQEIARDPLGAVRRKREIMEEGATVMKVVLEPWNPRNTVSFKRNFLEPSKTP